MKKFDKKSPRQMGSLPPQLFRYVGNMDIGTATAQFNECITRLADEFMTKFDAGIPKDKIELTASEIFGQPVKLKYLDSGSVGSVYKIQIGDEIFALKINRSPAFAFGELQVMPNQKRVRNLVNKMYIGAPFYHNKRRHSWVLSDFVATDYENSFRDAMEKMYYAYLTKGVHMTDSHPGNIKNARIIDPASLSKRAGKIDDIKTLNRFELDMVKKLVYYIKTDNVPDFEKTVLRLSATNPAVIKYMFFAMKYGRSPIFGAGKTDSFAVKLRKFGAIIDSAYRTSNADGRVVISAKNKMK